jgi:hypothetical protein
MITAKDWFVFAICVVLVSSCMTAEERTQLRQEQRARADSWYRSFFFGDLPLPYESDRQKHNRILAAMSGLYEGMSRATILDLLGNPDNISTWHRAFGYTIFENDVQGTVWSYWATIEPAGVGQMGEKLYKKTGIVLFIASDGRLADWLLFENTVKTVSGAGVTGVRL